MPVSVDRLQFAPPETAGMLRALAFALVAHLLLMLALTWGISWNRDPVTLSVTAELWSAVPQEAAPRAVEPPPPLPVPVPEPVPAPVPASAPVVVAVVPQPAPVPVPVAAARDAEIVVEREKEKEKEKEKADARRKLLALEREKKRLAEKELTAQKRLEAQKELLAQRKLDALKQQELARVQAQAQAKAQAVERQKLEAGKRTRQAEDARRLEAQREDNLKRIQGLAEGSGTPDSRGTAARASGPSASYGGRVAARIKPNIVFTEDLAGNPRAEIEVRTSPDGTIIGQRVLKSSGVRGWDEAVLKAVIKTEVLPRDVDGRVPASLIIDFRPKD